MHQYVRSFRASTHPLSLTFALSFDTSRLILLSFDVDWLVGPKAYVTAPVAFNSITIQGKIVSFFVQDTTNMSHSVQAMATATSSIQELKYSASPASVTVNWLTHDRNQHGKYPDGRMGFSAIAIRPYGFIRKGSYGATVRLLQCVVLILFNFFA